MTTFTRHATLFLLTATCAAAFAAPAATLLFTQPGTKIVTDTGAERPAKRGDVIEAGERLVTPPGGISQLRLTDGSLVGLRPGSDLRVGKPGANGTQDPTFLALVQGGVRLIGSELMDTRKPSAMTLQSGGATVKLTGADFESAVRLPDPQKPQDTAAQGSYNRLLFGTGTISANTVVEPLSLRQVSFLGGGSLTPVKLASVDPGVFSVARPSIDLGTTAPASGLKSALTPSTGALSGKTISPVTIGAPNPAPLPAVTTTVAGLTSVPLVSTVSKPTLITTPVISLPPIVTTTIATKPKVTCTIQVVAGKRVCL